MAWQITGVSALAGNLCVWRHVCLSTAGALDSNQSPMPAEQQSANLETIHHQALGRLECQRCLYTPIFFEESPFLLRTSQLCITVVFLAVKWYTVCYIADATRHEQGQASRWDRFPFLKDTSNRV